MRIWILRVFPRAGRLICAVDPMGRPCMITAYNRRSQNEYNMDLADRNRTHGQRLADFLTGFRRAQMRRPGCESPPGRNAVWLNGQRVVASQYADYPDDKVMDEIDITPLLVPGHNHLAIQACARERAAVYRKGPAALWFEVHVTGRPAQRSTLCRRSPAYVSARWKNNAAIII